MTDDAPLTIEQIVDQIVQRRSDAAATMDLLHGYQQQVDAESGQLENPDAVRDYMAFFEDFISRAIEVCDRVAAALPQGAQAAHAGELRFIATQSSVEQRRCLIFRDKCINKPLPHERMRPLLNEISVTTRDQLTAFRDLATAAARIEAVLPPAPPPPEPDNTFDRRALFRRFIRPLDK